MDKISLNGFELLDYNPPEWTNYLNFQPSKRLKLCQLPTPIHEFHVPGLPKNVEMFIKRDDMTGGILGGNKHRKMEFLLADALHKGCNAVLTVGSASSSHCMASAMTAKMLGLDCYIIKYTFTINETPENEREEICKNPGVFLPILMCSTQIKKNKKPLDSNRPLSFLTNQEAVQKLEKETGKKIYLIPAGGSFSKVALYAYINAWEEMTSQGLSERFSDVIVVWGTGGTALGLAIGNNLTGSKLKVHGIAINKPSDILYKEAQQELDKIGLDVRSRDIVDIVDIHDFLGYRINRTEDYDFIAEVAKETGVLCDRVYVGKALKEAVYLLNNNPEKFQGNKILFVHSGGVLGQYDGKITDTLKKLYDLKVKDYELE